jgi:hypothetical protein
VGQVSATLRKVEGGYSHWCPGCEEMHAIWTEGRQVQWSFDGNLESPTFNPSVKITGKQCVIKNGKWTGEWVRGADGKALDQCCHYFLHAGVLKFCGDCTHALVGKNVPLPTLPEFMRDAE